MPHSRQKFSEGHVNAAKNDRTPEGPRGLNARANPSGEATDFIAFALAFIFLSRFQPKNRMSSPKTT